MPELPDLQVFSRNLQKALHGKKVAAVTLHSKKSNVTAAALKKALENSSIKTVKREGKELQFTFDNEAVLGLHLMLLGQLVLYKVTAEPIHSVIALQFVDGCNFAMTDYQVAATPTLN